MKKTHLRNNIKERIGSKYPKSVGTVLLVLSDKLQMEGEDWKYKDIDDIYTRPLAVEKIAFHARLDPKTVRAALKALTADGIIFANPNIAQSWRIVPDAIMALESNYKTRNKRVILLGRKMIRTAQARFYRNKLRGQKILLVERGKGEPPVANFTDPPQLMAIGAAWESTHPKRWRPSTDEGESVCAVPTSSYYKETHCECGVFCSHPAHHDAVEMVEETIDPELSKQISADCQHDLHEWQPFIYARAAFLCAVYEVIEAEQRQREAA